MAILRPFVLLLLNYNVNLKAVHIPGSSYILCDAMSRMQETPQLLTQYGMQPHTAPIPHHLLPESFNFS